MADRIWNDVISYKNLVHAIAGATGSTVALTSFFPLDTARTRLQVDDDFPNKHSLAVIKHIYEQEGFAALYRGWAPVVTSLCCSNFVYFYTYNSLKVIASSGVKPKPLKDLGLAFAAGVVNVLVTTPLWVVNSRLKVQGAKMKDSHHTKHHYNGILDGIRQIYQADGILGLWSGTLPSLVLVTNPAIHFMVYENLKRYAARLSNKKELSALTYFLLGAVAKAVATVTTYPMQVIQARLRVGRQSSTQYMTIMDQIRTIFRLSAGLSVRGLYKGLEAKLSQTILMAALMFLTYEKITHTVFRVMGVAKS